MVLLRSKNNEKTLNKISYPQKSVARVNYSVPSPLIEVRKGFLYEAISYLIGTLRNVLSDY